jgi:glycine/D-amino acid oxidase-like deaminating enzyme
MYTSCAVCVVAAKLHLQLAFSFLHLRVMLMKHHLIHLIVHTGAYIIPKRDGRIVLGATVEKGVWERHNTPAGIAQLIAAATKVCPELSTMAIEETWAGLRPVTPDTLPVLGASHR